MINIPNETGGQTGTENMPFLVFAWKPNENLKFYCIVLLSSSHSSIAILISSRTFPKALLIFKRASQKKRAQKLLSDSTNPPSRTFGSLEQLLSAKWIEKNLCWDPLPNNHEFHHRPQKHSPIIQLKLIKSLSNQVMRITSVSEPTALAGSSKLQASTLIRWNEIKINVYIDK